MYMHGFGRSSRGCARVRNMDRLRVQTCMESFSPRLIHHHHQTNQSCTYHDRPLLPSCSVDHSPRSKCGGPVQHARHGSTEVEHKFGKAPPNQADQGNTLGEGGKLGTCLCLPPCRACVRAHRKKERKKGTQCCIVLPCRCSNQIHTQITTIIGDTIQPSWS